MYIVLSFWEFIHEVMEWKGSTFCVVSDGTTAAKTWLDYPCVVLHLIAGNVHHSGASCHLVPRRA